MVEATRQADARDERRRLAVVQAEQNAENDRKRRNFSKQQNRTRLARAEEEKLIKRKNGLEAAAMERKARITTGVLRDKKKLIESVNGMMQQAQISGVGGQVAGRGIGGDRGEWAIIDVIIMYMCAVLRIPNVWFQVSNSPSFLSASSNPMNERVNTVVVCPYFLLVDAITWYSGTRSEGSVSLL